MEGLYGYTGKDILDGQRWFNATSLTDQPDAFWYFNVGLNIRIGRVDNISWFDNPLTMPYKTIMENKKKIKKVDDLDDKVGTMQKQLDSTDADVDSLKSDEDLDGVPNYFDREDSTPNGAIVDGAGRTIFYKDDNGDLVFNDPNYSEAAAMNNQGNNGQNNGGGNNVNNNYYNNGSGNNSGQNGNKGNGGNNNGWGNNNNNGNGSGNNGNSGNNNGAGGYASNNQGSNKKGKYTFNARDKNGKTVIMQGNGTGGYSAPGTASKIGFLPAIFFETNSTEVSRNAYPNLYEIARMLKSNPNVKLYVIGFADYRSTESYNKLLGKRRAQSVVNALVKYFGVSADQLIVESKGEAEPLTNMKNMNALAANRRVQFEVVGNPAIKSELGRNAPVQKTPKAYSNDPSTPKPSDFNKDINTMLKDTKPVETPSDSSNNGGF